MTIADKLQIILDTRDELSTNIINGTDYTSLSNVPFSQYPSLLEDAKINYGNSVGTSILRTNTSYYPTKYGITLSDVGLRYNAMSVALTPYALYYVNTISSVTLNGPLMATSMRFRNLSCPTYCFSSSGINKFNVEYDISQLNDTTDSNLSSLAAPVINIGSYAFNNSDLNELNIKLINFPDGYNPEDDDYARFPNLRPIVYIQNYLSCFRGSPLMKFPFKSLSVGTGLPAYTFNQAGKAGVSDESIADGGTELIADLSSGPYISSLTTINEDAFVHARFYKIYIGDNVTDIGVEAFRYSTAKAIYLGNSVNNIGNRAFGNNTSLLSCVFMGDVPTTLGTNLFATTTKCTVYVSRAYPNWESYITAGTFFGRPIKYFD